jgi:ribosomal protein S15P/S13E
MAKHTWPEHPDYESMNSLVTQIATLGAFLNTKNREAENMRSLIELTNHIAKLPSTLLIVEPHRRLVQEYAIPEQKTMVYFFNDMLLVGKTGGFSKDIKYKDHYFLLSIVLKDYPDDKQHKNTVSIFRTFPHFQFH